MSGVSDIGVFQIVWPGVSTLLGALAGGGVTLWANLQKNSQEQRASNEARKRSIKDRSFNACVDVLKAGRLAAAEGNNLRWDLFTGAPHDRIVEYRTQFDNAVRNWYSAASAAQLTLPPAAKGAFDNYMVALAAFLEEVNDWMTDYLAPTSSDAEKNEARSEESARLRAETLAKRDEFVEVAKTQFDEGVWSKT